MMSGRSLGILLIVSSSVALAEQREHCLNPSLGSNPVFLRWVGAIGGGSESVVKLGPNPARVTVDLKSGWQRSTIAPRTVSVQRIGVSPQGGVKALARLDTSDVAELTFGLDRNQDPLLTDTYVFTFTPTGAGAKKPEECAFLFADLWNWAGDNLSDSSPLAAALNRSPPTAFDPGVLQTAPLQTRLFGGDAPGALSPNPQMQLWLEQIKPAEPEKLAAKPPAHAPHDPLWKLQKWSSGSSSTMWLPSELYKSIGFNVWLCAATTEARDAESCVVAARYKLNDALVLRVQTEGAATVRQGVPFGQLFRAGTLSTFGVVFADSPGARTKYSYAGALPGTLDPEVSRLVDSEQHVEYTMVPLGSAELEHFGGHCPGSLPKTNDKITIFGASSEVDVIRCLYRREAGKEWLGAADDSSERPFLDSLRFQLCTSTKCADSTYSRALGLMGFRLPEGAKSVTWRVVQAEGKHPFGVEGTKFSAPIAVVTLPPLPAAPVSEGIMASVQLSAFTPMEWDAKHAAACLESGTDWKQLGISDDVDGGATLMLWAGDARRPVGSGRWKLETVDSKQLLCPILSKEDVDDLLARVRSALLAGQSAALYAVQGGRLVGHTVMLSGPTRASVISFELFQAGDQLMTAFTPRTRLSTSGRLCALTTGDWGDKIAFDPSTITLRGDHGELLAAFETRGKVLHSFSRVGGPEKTGMPNTWRYCSGVVDEGASVAPDVLEARHPDAPGADVTRASWSFAGGCASGTGGCGSIPVAARSFTWGRNALAAFNVGLGWGHVLSFASQVPATEVRTFVAAPLAVGQWSIFNDVLTPSIEAGPMVGLSWGRGLRNDVFTTRIAVPLSGYVAACVSGTGLRSMLGTSPRLCLGASLDLITFKSTSTGVDPSSKFGVEGFGLTPYLSIGLGDF